MKKGWIIETIEMDCPLCDKIHKVEKRRRFTSYLIKGEPTEFQEDYFYCPNFYYSAENEFVSAEMMDENLQRAREAYNKKHKEQ